MLPFAIGIGLTICLLFVAWGLGLEKDRGVWVTTMISIASFYVLFAVQYGDLKTILIQIGIALTFIGLALFGYKRSLYWVAAALLLHAIYDGIMFGHDPAPEWWGPFCLAVDFLLAAALFYWIKTGHIAETLELNKDAK